MFGDKLIALVLVKVYKPVLLKVYEKKYGVSLNTLWSIMFIILLFFPRIFLENSFSISKTLKEKDNILSIYFTAGFPELNSTIEIIKNLVSAGVDMIEIGLPFSDPLADGETIQMSSKIALDNGISTNILFCLLYTSDAADE